MKSYHMKKVAIDVVVQINVCPNRSDLLYKEIIAGTVLRHWHYYN
jgi:hypothetical protein